MFIVRPDVDENVIKNTVKNGKAEMIDNHLCLNLFNTQLLFYYNVDWTVLYQVR